MKLERSLTRRVLPACLFAAAVLLVGTAAHHDDDEILFAESRIYWEYNSSGNDLGVHVSLDGEDWRSLKIKKPDGKKLFEVKGHGPYKMLGMTELFFEGAEPNLDDFPLEDLLELFPEGEYEFEGKTVDGDEIEGESDFTHAIPDGPDVQTQQGPDHFLKITWTDVTGPPPGFPDEDIVIDGYQVIVGSFEVTLPASANSVTVPPEYVASLGPGVHDFEVLAIEEGGNQSITEGIFTK